MASTKIEKVRYAIFHNPGMIRTLMKDTSIKKGMIYHELNKILPCRVGIEFELSGNFNKGFFSDHPDMMPGELTKYKNACIEQPGGGFTKIENATIRDYYNLKDFSSDLCSSDLCNENYLYEVRVSIDKYKQLSSLHRILGDISKYCNYHQNGGIHIHVDMTQYLTPSWDSDSELSKLMSRYITRRLDEIIKIFPKYTGSYNNKEVGIRRKKTYVNISRLNTLEFRIAPLTFDYTTLITWISGLMKFRRKLITELRLVENYDSDSKKNRLNTGQDLNHSVTVNENEDNELTYVLHSSPMINISGSSYYTDSTSVDASLYSNDWCYYHASHPGLIST